jgi:hypothetical protein
VFRRKSRSAGSTKTAVFRGPQKKPEMFRGQQKEAGSVPGSEETGFARKNGPRAQRGDKEVTKGLQGPVRDMPRAQYLFLSKNGFIALPADRLQPDPGPQPDPGWAAFISNQARGVQPIATITGASEDLYLHRTWLFRHATVSMTVDVMPDNRFVLDFSCLQGRSEVVVSRPHAKQVPTTKSEEDCMARFAFHPERYTECMPNQRKQYVFNPSDFSGTGRLKACIKHLYEDGFVDVTGLDILVTFA